MMKKTLFLTLALGPTLGLLQPTTASHDNDKIVFVAYRDTFLCEEEYHMVKASFLQQDTTAAVAALREAAGKQGCDAIYFFSSEGWTSDPTKAITYDPDVFYDLITSPNGQALFHIELEVCYDFFLRQLNANPSPEHLSKAHFS